MSALSDWQCGAITYEEFLQLTHSEDTSSESDLTADTSQEAIDEQT